MTIFDHDRGRLSIVSRKRSKSLWSWPVTPRTCAVAAAKQANAPRDEARNLRAASRAPCVEHDAVSTFRDAWHSEATAREALVVDDEAASVPKEYFDAITATSDEDEEMPSIRIELEHTAHERRETVVPSPKVDRRNGEVDLRARRDAQHERSAATSELT
jgi:hypothetical protein